MKFDLCDLIQVLHAFAAEGAHCGKIRDILNASDVSFELVCAFSYFFSYFEYMLTYPVINFQDYEILY